MSPETDATESAVLTAKTATVPEIAAWVEDTRRQLEIGVSMSSSVLETALDHLTTLLGDVARLHGMNGRELEHERPSRAEQREHFPALTWYADDPPPIGQRVRRSPVSVNGVVYETTDGIVIGAGTEDGNPRLRDWWIVQYDNGFVGLEYPPSLESVP